MSNSYAMDEEAALRSSDAGTIASDSVFVKDSRHQIEWDVKRQLLSSPGLRFSSLVVRRVPDGVCLEGVLEADDDRPDVCSLVRQVAGVQNVLNHLVLRQPSRTSAKG
jgi:osmotically-inducible protein OsmY